MSTPWKPIADAPKDGTGVFLRSKHFVSDFMMMWSAKRKRWEGQVLMPLGATRITWDSAVEEPTHYRLPIPL